MPEESVWKIAGRESFISRYFSWLSDNQDESSGRMYFKIFINIILLILPLLFILAIFEIPTRAAWEKYNDHKNNSRNEKQQKQLINKLIEKKNEPPLYQGHKNYEYLNQSTTYQQPYQNQKKLKPLQNQENLHQKAENLIQRQQDNEESIKNAILQKKQALIHEYTFQFENWKLGVQNKIINALSEKANPINNFTLNSPFGNISVTINSEYDSQKDTNFRKKVSISIKKDNQTLGNFELKTQYNPERSEFSKKQYYKYFKEKELSNAFPEMDKIIEPIIEAKVNKEIHQQSSQYQKNVKKVFQNM